MKQLGNKNNLETTAAHMDVFVMLEMLRQLHSHHTSRSCWTHTQVTMLYCPTVNRSAQFEADSHKVQETTQESLCTLQVIHQNNCSSIIQLSLESTISFMWFMGYLLVDHLVGLMVKASASTAADPVLIPLSWGFNQAESYQWFKNW